MRMRGQADIDVWTNEEDSKSMRIELGEVRCPKCHRRGTLVVYLTAEKTIRIIARIVHCPKMCYLTPETSFPEGQTVVDFLPLIYNSTIEEE
jgi:hypothetical protein